MSEYLIYGGEHYVVLRQGPGVLIRQLATNATQWLQGDEADELEARFEHIQGMGVADDTAATYFGNDQ